MQEKAPFFKSSWCYSRFLIYFSIRKKVAYFVFRDASSPVNASNLYPLNPDLLMLYRRPNPIKIWPTYAVPPTTTLYPRSTYDLWRAGSSRSPWPLRAGTTNPRCILDQHTLSPIKDPLLPIGLFFRAGVDRLSGVNGL